ncbi:hypothetical protein M407DRAFT_26592 [Tulasnella calospora MUT 4182]|uniref:Uncharacterized protein n=1 Tax=Tulasnella calospora MUT 4182 TaxID=1051891 RepID=A0A0C3KRC3_9AGAM|nr:hypothetical protein M407DRAFT_26592 [Tulasnella calospora MUT 4182]
MIGGSVNMETWPGRRRKGSSDTSESADVVPEIDESDPEDGTKDGVVPMLTFTTSWSSNDKELDAGRFSDNRLEPMAGRVARAGLSIWSW